MDEDEGVVEMNTNEIRRKVMDGANGQPDHRKVSDNVVLGLCDNLDATRAKLAEAEHELAHMRSVSPALLVTAYKQQAKRLAEVERERDEALEFGAKANAEWRRNEAGWQECWHSLAAWQAECARLREALEERGEHGRKCPWAYFSAGRPKDGGGYEMLYQEAWYEVRPDDKRPACTCGLNAALASAPGSMDALGRVCFAAVRSFVKQRMLDATDEEVQEAVARILGERAKEDGDDPR